MNGSASEVPPGAAGTPPGPAPVPASFSFVARLVVVMVLAVLMIAVVIGALGYLLPRRTVASRSLTADAGSDTESSRPEGSPAARGEDGETDEARGRKPGDEDAGSTAGAGDQEGEEIPDIDPALFKNRLEAVSGGTKPIWEEGTPATLVDFWASWCGPCLAELPHLQELQERVEGRGMKVVLINVDLDEREAAGRFLHRRGIRLDTLVDRDAVLFQAIGLEALPSTFVLDAKGRPVAFFVGGMSRRELEDALVRANEKHVRTTFR